MTEDKWKTEAARCQWMLRVLQESYKATQTAIGRRKLRLFACGCCRPVWEWMEPLSLREAVDVAERFADGMASKDELTKAGQALHPLCRGGFQEKDKGAGERTRAALA